MDRPWEERLRNGELLSARESRSSYEASVCNTTAGASSWQEELRSAGVVSAAGAEQGVSKTNQDASFFLRRSRGGDDWVAGVIDGHGMSGHHVASFVKQTLPREILEQRRSSNNKGTRHALARGFEGTANKLRRNRNISSEESGAVVAMCIRTGQDLYAANAGDTRAVLVTSSSEGKVRGEALTRDHTPALASEKERIHRNGGEVAPTYIPGMGFGGPLRVWKKKQLAGGLAVSRAIGDSALNDVGVTPQPEVIKHRVRPCDKYVVIASDGCWDCVTNERAAELAVKHGNPERASEAIVKEARRNWQQDGTNGGYIDDITCVVAKV